MDREQVNILYALDSFKKMRSVIIEKTLYKDLEIYLGLHSIGNNLLEIYLERSKIDWLLEHFEIFKKIIDDEIRPEEKEYKKDCVEYFSKIFQEFLEWNGKSFKNSEIAIDFMKELESGLNNMIYFSDNWEKGYDQLCVMIAKNKEKYQKIKKEMMEV